MHLLQGIKVVLHDYRTGADANCIWISVLVSWQRSRAASVNLNLNDFRLMLCTATTSAPGGVVTLDLNSRLCNGIVDRLVMFGQGGDESCDT